MVKTSASDHNKLVASAWGVEVATVRYHRRENPAFPKNETDPEKLRQWYSLHVRDGGPQTKKERALSALIVDDIDDARTPYSLNELAEAKLRAEVEKLEQDARAKKLKTDILEGQLWPAAEVLSLWRQSRNILQARLAALPDALAADLPIELQEQQRRRADKIIRLALLELERTEIDPLHGS